MTAIEYEFEVDNTSPRSVQIVIYDIANNPLSKKLLKDLERVTEDLVRKHGPTLAINRVLGDQE